jgi:hypothetical protein
MTVCLALITPTLCALASVSDGLEGEYLERGYEAIKPDRWDTLDAAAEKEEIAWRKAQEEARKESPRDE